MELILHTGNLPSVLPEPVYKQHFAYCPLSELEEN